VHLYTRTAEHEWTYTSLATGGDAHAVVDAHGFVVDEDGAFTRA